MTFPWYKEGLAFKCTECGKCCTGGPGLVWVEEEKITEMAEFLGLSIELFKRKYLRLRDNRYALAEKKSTKECIFLKEKKCLVYKARPRQCMTYPWWKENLSSEESWQLAAQSCEGINEQAPKVSYAEIQRFLQANDEIVK